MSPTMQYVRLGNSGLKVSRIILGCLSYGDPRWQEWVLGEEEALKHIKFAYEHGITTFDTANAYSNGLSEVILGNVIRKLNLPREEIVIMTKLFAPVVSDVGVYTLPFDAAKAQEHGIINQRGLSRKHIFDSVKSSLKRLQVDYIDLLQCHRFDYETPIEETMQALHDVVKAGYVRYIGMSSCYAYQFHQMQNYAITHNLTPFISMQNHYSLLYREEEREMFPTLKQFGVGATPWSPLARGKLTRPFKSDSKRGQTDDCMAFYRGDASEYIVNHVEELSKKKGPGVSAPIIGTTSLSNLEDILGALDVKLTEEEIKYLEEPYTPKPISGHY
ncbi:oxidoreductase [Trametes maxima]|nr:oxidoreductase [Trametes maxima]